MLQQTIRQPISFQGVGLHSGTPSTVTLQPAPANAGIRFLPFSRSTEAIPAHVSYVRHLPLCTALQREDVTILTIEHLTSACAGLSIHNLLIEVDGEEIPILDGSALPFVEKILQVGTQRQASSVRYIEVQRKITLQDGKAWASIEPSSDELCIELTLDYAHPAIAPEFANYTYNSIDGDFATTIAPARTFCFHNDLTALQERGLIKGGTLANAVVLSSESWINPEGLRFPNEPIRHKVLDAVGDLALSGAPLIGRFQGYCSGHKLNTMLVQRLLATQAAY